ncbi:hypothetical protein PR202_gb29138 [Eleusine coracana subsp. coracana]|uniref:Uncharacterized protein n=1 Tax=Eleusine coracana subsp. coracana TaxID=191504 RepID=A0AAV5FYN4_ELECO|nr:hypothetical protein PR202_gb29138 [Eleusine coracana subsp. coracana]
MANGNSAPLRPFPVLPRRAISFLCHESSRRRLSPWRSQRPHPGVAATAASPSSLFDEVLPSEAASLISLCGFGPHRWSLPGGGKNLSRSSTPGGGQNPQPPLLPGFGFQSGARSLQEHAYDGFCSLRSTGRHSMVSSGFHSLLFPSSKMSFTIVCPLFDVRLED